ncbi:response regulator transcription factor [Wolinella succinogenes]|uniref:response regulator transcription factor n=1 Tax=Wolinella succinogenes TaxID=844 RepID=UPI002FC8E5FD
MEAWQESLKNLTLLYVEDEEGIRRPMVDTLSYYLKEVYEAEDGEAGLECYYTHRPDIIFTDLKMPHRDGLWMVREIRKHDKHTPIAMITAHSDKEYLLSAVELKMEKYLIKPIALEELLHVLRLCIEDIEEERGIVLECGSVRFDLKNHLFIKEERETPLTQKESDFLALLLRKKGQLIPYEEIESQVWRGEFMSTDALRTLVKNLRKKLGIPCIKNHSLAGYSFEG